MNLEIFLRVKGFTFSLNDEKLFFSFIPSITGYVFRVLYYFSGRQNKSSSGWFIIFSLAKKTVVFFDN